MGGAPLCHLPLALLCRVFIGPYSSHFFSFSARNLSLPAGPQRRLAPLAQHISPAPSSFPPGVNLFEKVGCSENFLVGLSFFLTPLSSPFGLPSLFFSPFLFDGAAERSHGLKR